MTRHTARRTFRCTALTAGTLSALLAFTACASPDQEGSGTSTEGGSSEISLDSALVQAATDKAKTLGEDLGGSIEVIGPNGGKEGAILEAVYGAFEAGTGTTVNYTGSTDNISVVQSRVAAGNAPDIADISIGVATDFAEQGELLDLNEIIPEDELANYPQSLLDNASYDGKLFGIYQGFSNFMVWYNPEQYTGPTDPTEWSELTSWTDQLASEGTPAWCIAEEAGAGSGFPGSQFIENLFVKKYGADLTKQWGLSELSWTSPEVKDAWEMFGDIATDDAKVSGGVTGSLAASIATGSNGLVEDPATCQAVLWGSWVPGLIGAAVEPGTNLDFFRVPASNPDYADDEVFQTTTSIAFNDTPQVRAFLQYLASTEAQTLLASADQWTVSNTAVPADTYSSTLLQKAATTFFNDQVQLAVGPNVLADGDVALAFNKGVVTYLQDPSSLDSVLAGIQALVDAK